MERNLEDYGNKLTIQGFLVGNGEELELVVFPNGALVQEGQVMKHNRVCQEDLLAIFNQLDRLDITNSQKVVLRKSQRNIDQELSWEVFRRDDYTCVYCGTKKRALTVDHLVLWEEMGDTVPANLVTACKKCNHTRGNKPLPEFLNTSYFNTVHGENKAKVVFSKEDLLTQFEIAKLLPLRKPRSR